MLPPLFSELSKDSGFQLSFSYRYSLKYEKGLRKRIPLLVPEFPRYYPYFSGPSKHPGLLPRLFRGVFLRLWVLIGVPILVLYEILDLFFLLKKLKPDVLHVNNGGYPAAPSARAAIIAGKLSGVPLKIMVVNNMAQDYRSLYRFCDYPLDRVVAHFTDYFVTGSQCAMNQLIDVLNLSSNKTIVIPNGITGPETDLNFSSVSFNTSHDFAGVTFAIIAELVPRKGHIHLLKAIAELRDSQHITPNKFRLLVAGDGYLSSELESYILENGLEEFVFFVGYLDNIYGFLENIDVLVLPSVGYEDFPYVVLEAMSMMKPIIGSRVAGIPEQIDHGINGLLVNPGNHLELAEAIETLYSQPSLRESMGKYGNKKFLANFTVKIATEKYLKLYSRLKP